MAPLCSTSNLLITDQGGRTCASFASVASFPALCEWQAVLHAGDWARTFAVVPLHVYSAHSEQQSYIYPNLPHCYDTVVQEGTVTLLSSRPEKVAVDHLLHKTRRANEKQLSPVTHTVGYFTEIKGVGASCGYLEDLWHQNISQTTRCTVRWFRNILHPDNTVVCHLRHFLNLEQCSDAWEQVVPGRRFLSVLYNVALCWQRGRRCRYRPVSSCLRQRGEDQGWARVRLFLSSFQCAFYSPARRGHPHPVPTTHLKQARPALPANVIQHISVANTHPSPSMPQREKNVTSQCSLRFNHSRARSMMQSDNVRRYKRSPEIPQTHPWIQSMHKRLKVRQHNVVSDNKSQHAKQARHRDEKLMFPSGTQPPYHVPQCLTEVWAAGARRAPQQDLGPLLSLCVCSGERTVIGQRDCEAAGTCDRERVLDFLTFE